MSELNPFYYIPNPAFLEARKRGFMKQKSGETGPVKIAIDSPKLSYNMHEVSEATGISRTKLYDEIAEGKLIACKIGSRTIIRKHDLETYLANLQPFVSSAK